VVVGAGYVGIEMAEAMARRGLHVTVVDRAEEPMTTLDPDMGALVRQAMEAIGIGVRMRSTVTGFEGDRADRVARVVTSEGSLAADVVVLGSGCAPTRRWPRGPAFRSAITAASAPTRGCGCPATTTCGRAGTVSRLDLVSGQYRHVPLGTHANKHGRVIGMNIGGVDASFPGVLGTAVSKVCDLEIGRTGLLEDEARRAGFEAVTATVRSSTKAGYFPGNPRLL
jgi:NADPH-dependent 2,4-dienoyl-CoA reductase/sulfur reductase-like enzyme